MKEFLTRSAFAKVLLLAALTIAAALPLAQIGGLIEERGASRGQAAAELASRHAGPQVLAGPLLVVPYVERWTEEERNDKGELKARVPRSKAMHHIVFPQTLDLRGKLVAEERYRGIFSVLFYQLQGGLAGRFPPFDPATLRPSEKGGQLEVHAPVLALALSDVRGLQGAPVLQLAGESAAWQPRVPALPEDSWMARGIHAPLPAAALQAWQRQQPMDFKLDLVLVGQERLSIVPVAGENTAHLVSDWPHPSFGGEFLAKQRKVSERGFEAAWAVSSLVSSARAQIAAGAPVEKIDSFDISLVEPLNVYALSSRAVKYGLLFVALTLLAAFMFELFRSLPLHPVQYGLVGLSITLFFLLLLALSEKLAFSAAYAIAAGASVLLLTVYFSAVLQGWRRGVGLGAYVAVLYGTLYGLLSSEDNALLLGALLLFGLLGLLMVGTRRVDWYALAASSRRDAPAEAA